MASKSLFLPPSLQTRMLMLALLLVLNSAVSDDVYCPQTHRQFICGEFVYDIPANADISVRGDPKGCSRSTAQLSCEQNRSTVVYLIGKDPIRSKFYLQVHTGATKFLLLDPGLQKNNCSTLPMFSYIGEGFYLPEPGDWMVAFVSCKRAVKSPSYIDTAPCLTGNEFSNGTSTSPGNLYSYVVIGKLDLMVVSDIEDMCTLHRIIISPFPVLDDISDERISFQDIHDALAGGYEFYMPSSGETGGSGGSYESVQEKRKIRNYLRVSGPIIGCVSVTFVIAGIYHACSVLKNKQDLENQKRLERFLEDYTAMRPTRYSYADIKKITNNFKHGLGKGGQGNVFKGKVANQVFVAVKMLHEYTGNGDDFINEVGTLGATHHVNVVRLLGFCADGAKKALVYEFVPNGSLDKFIFNDSQEEHHKLGMATLEGIAVGIARGVEYLHQGCEQRILHFDIKPHNILLDEDYNPKISDFGLAKLCEKGRSAVSMTAARGTMGYIAPEVFSRHFGSVTHKSDIYSFGMLLLEMMGRRKNIDANAKNVSQVNFPEWVYGCLVNGEDLRIQVEDDDELQIAKKIAIVGLWCIQWNPMDRPSIMFVIQMLEANAKDLTLPPNPFSSDICDQPSGSILIGISEEE